MADEVSTTLKPIAVPPNNYNPIAAANFKPGTPVTPSQTVPSEVVAAQAGIVNTAFAVGLVGPFGGRAGVRADVQFAGLLTLPIADWNALITGATLGLTEGALYYVQDDSEAAGRLTTTDPGVPGTFVGIAVSPESLMLQMRSQITGGAGVTGEFAMYYGVTAGTGSAGTDYAATIGVGTPVPFPKNGPTAGANIERSAIATIPANGGFEAVVAGIYEVSWAIDFLEESQLQLAILTAGPTYTPIANTTATSGAGTQQNSNKVLVALTAGQSIALINPAGNGAALTVQTADGTITHAQAPNLTIVQLA